MTILISYYRKYRGVVIVALVVVGVSLIGGLILYKGMIPFGRQTARLEIEGDTYRRAFEGEVIENMTAFEALQAAAKAGNISFTYGFENGKFVVKSLDGYEAGKSAKSVIFYLNNTPIELGQLHNVPIKEGDIITVKIK